MHLSSETAVTAALGAAVGAIVGYFVHAAHNSATTFEHYLVGPFRYRNYKLLDVLQFEAAWWALFGIAAALGMLYLTRR